MTAGWVVLAVLAAVILWAIGAYNGLVNMRQRAKQAFADIDVQLKQRHDLIPNLVETVKGYAGHERGTLEDVIKARNAAMSAQGPCGRSRPKPAFRRARPADRAVGGLSRPQGQRQLPAASGRTVRHREQARCRPPLLQQRGWNTTPASSRLPGGAVRRRNFGFQPQTIFDVGEDSRKTLDNAPPQVKF
jgi:LemA protein